MWAKRGTTSLDIATGVLGGSHAFQFCEVAADLGSVATGFFEGTCLDIMMCCAIFVCPCFHCTPSQVPLKDITNSRYGTALGLKFSFGLASLPNIMGRT